MLFKTCIKLFCLYSLPASALLPNILSFFIIKQLSHSSFRLPLFGLCSKKTVLLGLNRTNPEPFPNKTRKESILAVKISQNRSTFISKIRSKPSWRDKEVGYLYYGKSKKILAIYLKKERLNVFA